MFEAGGALALGDFEPRGHADIWVLYHMVIDTMADFGPDLGFRSRVKVKYPHDGIVEDGAEESYANPLNMMIYIESNGDEDDGTDIDTLVHELGHIYLYQHSRLEDAMAAYLVTHAKRGTHDIVDYSFVAYHEGAAEFFKEQVLSLMLGHTPAMPRSRAGMRRLSLADLDDVEHFDDGWTSLFTLLTLDDVWRYEFRTSNSFLGELRSLPFWAFTCREPRLTFEEWLRVQEGDDGVGLTRQIGIGEMNFRDFFRRAGLVGDDLTAADRVTYTDMLDPQSTNDVFPDLCDPLFVKSSPLP